MKDLTPSASQENILFNRAASTDAEVLFSSPVPQPPRKEDSGKARKAPTITPRSFTRFFTPKSSLEKGGKIGASRQALRDITASGANRNGRRIPTENTTKTKRGETRGADGLLRGKKRKIPGSLDTTPERSSPLKRIRNQSLEISEDYSSDDSSGIELLNHFETPGRLDTKILNIAYQIIPSKYRGPLGRELRREIGAYGTNMKTGSYGYQLAGAKEWQCETTNFSTNANDTYVCTNVAAQSANTIPFCTASCNSESSVWIFLHF